MRAVARRWLRCHQQHREWMISRIYGPAAVAVVVWAWALIAWLVNR